MTLSRTLSRRGFLGTAVGTTALAMPFVARAQARELVMIGYGTAQDDPIKRAATRSRRRGAHPPTTLP
jgi:putative spermidine/putrescine transport system substrate-binding protein